MPIYDYDCLHCRVRTEVIHGINDAGPRFCPACGAEGTMRKAMSSPAVHFKGSGWAKKDRSSTSGSKVRSSTAASSDGASGSTDKGGEPAVAAADGSTGAGAKGSSSGGSSSGASTASAKASSGDD